MKRFACLLMMMLVMLPALGAWMPYGILQTLHVQHETHHTDNTAGYVAHEHGAQINSHPIYFDVNIYFDDYLHADLKTPDDEGLLTARLQPLKYLLLTDAMLRLLFVSNMRQQNLWTPNDDGRLAQSSTQVYLITQRLRI